MNYTPPSPRARLAYIDWLRFIVVLSLAPFHAAISFTGMGSVYVYDTPVLDILLAGGAPVNMGPFALTCFHGELVYATALSRIGDRRCFLAPKEKWRAIHQRTR